MKKLVFLGILLVPLLALAQDSAWRDVSLTPTATENGSIITGGPQELNVTRKYMFSRSGEPPQSAGFGIPAPTIEIDFSQSPPGSGNTFTVNTGQTMTQQDAPVRVTDGTWPMGVTSNQGYAWKFDGVNDYITSSIDPPSGSFSVMCAVMPSAATVNGAIIGHYDSSSKRGWVLYQSTAATTFSVSDDGTSGGGHFTVIQVAASLFPGCPSVIVGTYEYIGDGSSIMKLYVNENTAASSTSADGPVFSGAGGLVVARAQPGGSTFAGQISHCAVFNGAAFTETQARAIIRNWRGVLSTDKILTTVTASTSPSLILAPGNSGTEPFIIHMPANTVQVGNTGTCYGAYVAYSISNLIRRSYLRTWNGGDGGTGCGDYPTGWAAYCSAGDGTVSVSKDTTTMAADTQSAKITLTGTTSLANLFSTCRSDGVGNNLRASVWYKCTSGTCNSSLFFRQYTTASDCSGAYVDNSVACTGSSWNKCIYTIASGAWNASTKSYRIILVETGNSGVTSNWSAPQMVSNASYALLNTDAFCGNDADADPSCSAVNMMSVNPLSPNGNFAFSIKSCSSWDAIDATGDSRVVGDGSGANTTYINVIPSSDEPLYAMVDSSSNSRYNNPNVLNWSAYTPYQIIARHYNYGYISLWWNSSWVAAMAGAGTGIRTASQNNIGYGCLVTGQGSNLYTSEFSAQAARPTTPPSVSIIPR